MNPAFVDITSQEEPFLVVSFHFCLFIVNGGSNTPVVTDIHKGKQRRASKFEQHPNNVHNMSYLMLLITQADINNALGNMRMIREARDLW